MPPSEDPEAFAAACLLIDVAREECRKSLRDLNGWATQLPEVGDR